jgi:hypothetical protein
MHAASIDGQASRVARLRSAIALAVILALPLACCSQNGSTDIAPPDRDSAYVLLSTFGRAFGMIAGGHSPPVDHTQLIVSALQGIGVDPRLADEADRKIIAAAVAEAKRPDRFGDAHLLTVFGQVFESLRQTHRVPDTTLVERALTGMASGIDTRTFYIPQCDSGDDVIRRERAGKYGIVGRGPGANPANCPADLAAPAQPLRQETNSDPLRLHEPPAGPIPVFSTAVGPFLYIRLDDIHDGIDSELRATFARLRYATNGTARGIIIDLRANQGGLLIPAHVIPGLMLPPGAPIARIVAVSPDETQNFVAEGGDITGGLPIVVLTSDRTAAGAEIIAGALQDNGRAIIMGGVTYGNGSVQTVIPGLGLGWLVLTTGYTILPAGRNLQDFGVRPDIELWQPNARQAALWQAIPPARRWPGLASAVGHIGPVPAAAKAVAYPLHPEDDPAVQAAIQALKLGTQPSGAAQLQPL